MGNSDRNTQVKNKFAHTYREKVICPLRGVNLLLVSTVYHPDILQHDRMTWQNALYLYLVTLIFLVLAPTEQTSDSCSNSMVVKLGEALQGMIEINATLQAKIKTLELQVASLKEKAGM